MRQSPKSSNKPRVSPTTAVSFSFEAIGTHWQIELYEPLAPTALSEIKDALHARIDDFDASYSRFRSDSLVTAISHQAGTYQLPSDAAPLFSLYRTLYQLTGGAVTPLVGRALSDAGYDASYSFQSHDIPQTPTWDEAMTFSKGVLTTFRPVLLDFGAAGKGYLVDIIGELLESSDIRAYCIDAGGDIRFRHPNQPLAIGLEHPRDPNQAVGVIELRNQSICGSAGNRRAWGDFHHIFNPYTAKPEQAVTSSWVIADSTLVADGLATALFFAPPEKLAAEYDFTYARIAADNSISYSPTINGEIF